LIFARQELENHLEGDTFKRLKLYCEEAIVEKRFFQGYFQ